MSATPAGWDDPVYDVEVCSICGCDMQWVDCWECHGEGAFDYHEMSPIEYGPADIERCETCQGKGGYLECEAIDSAAHYQAAQARRAS